GSRRREDDFSFVQVGSRSTATLTFIGARRRGIWGRGGTRPYRALAHSCRAFVHHAPDAAALTVAAWMRERHFVMADDAIVKIRDVKRAIGTELIVHGPEPRI